MAAARYWRLVGLATEGGALGLSAAILVDVAGSRLDGSATLTCSHAPSEGTLGALADGNGATSARWSGGVHRSGGFYIQWDLGSPQDVCALQLGGDQASSWPGRVTLAYLDTGTGLWTVLLSADWLVYPGDGALTAPTDADPFFVIPSRAVGAAPVDSRGHVITVTGSVGFSAAQQLAGQNSIYFPGTSGNDLVAAGADFALGTVALTFDTWFYISSNSAADVDGARGAALFSSFNDSGVGFNITLLGDTTTTGTGLALDTWGSAGNGKLYRAASSISHGAWHHFEGSVDGSGTRRLFLDGTLLSASYINIGSAPSNFAAPENAMWIGRTNNSNYPLRLAGYLINPRIIMGVRHTEDFTPSSTLSAPTTVRRGVLTHRSILGASAPISDPHVLSQIFCTGSGSGSTTSSIKTWDGSQWNTAGRVVVWTAP